MICVSIGRGRHKMLMAEHGHVARLGAKLAELRLDYLLRTVDLNRLVNDRPTETVITCRRPVDGGKWRGSEEDRIILLRSAIVTGVEYVDIEEDIASQIRRYGKTKRIISYHNLKETPSNLEAIYESMLEKDPDIIKIATFANSPVDNVRVLNLVKKSKVPTIAFCMGDLGMPSRIICLKYGAPFTFAALSNERATAPGQFTFKQLNDLYGVERINSETEFLGVIADPVGHSLSPALHNELLQNDGINKVYLPIRVPRESLDVFMESIREMALTGLSVTIPHKESILRYVNGLDEDVAGIRAANTLVVKNNSNLAYNTDCKAAMLSLAHEEGKYDQKQPFVGRTALILGSGGVAKAIAFGLTKGGATVAITGRNTKTAEKMAQDFKAKYVDWSFRHDFQTDYIINCTPAGMHPDLNSTAYDVDRLQSHHLVFDTVYTPQKTMLIKGAMERGCRIITGVDMFVRQAAMQYKLFTGTDPNVAEMKRIFVQAINPAKFSKKAGSPKTSDKQPPTEADKNAASAPVADGTSKSSLKSKTSEKPVE